LAGFFAADDCEEASQNTAGNTNSLRLVYEPLTFSQNCFNAAAGWKAGFKAEIN
jgi:hypothetical protein